MYYIKIFILMVILLVFPGSEPMTGVAGNKVMINSCFADGMYFHNPEDSAWNVEMKCGDITATDTSAVDYGKYQDHGYWFIGINLYPK